MKSESPNMLKHSYIVDTGLGAFRAQKFNSKNLESSQELFCKCGGRYKFNQKVKREILITDAPIYQSEYDLSSISCPYCEKVYDINKKINLIEPNYGSIMEINFFLKKQKLSNNSYILRLVKERVYAFYSDVVSNPVLQEISVFDEININLTTKELNIFIDNSKFVDTYNKVLMKSIDGSEKNTLSLNLLEKNLSYSITFGTLNQIKKFFYSNSGIEYNNLENCFLFFQEISKDLIDFDKIKKSPYTYISSFWDNHKIYLEKITKDNEVSYKRHIFIEDEFSFDNQKIKQEFNAGSYITSINHLAFSIFAIQCYSNISTIFSTKGYRFFESFINSDAIVNPNVLKFHGATYPSKILEICANYDRFGKSRNITGYKEKSVEDILDITPYLKYSNLIYSKTSQPNDILELKKFIEKNYLNKLQLEQLFQKYDESSLYKVFGILGQSDKRSELTFRHIEHIIRHKIYVDSNDFLNSYCDTIKVLKNIVKTQPAVIKHIESNKNISQKEKDALGVYLAVKENQLFEIRNGKDLNRFHDNMSILFNVFQDATKVEAYAIAVDKFVKLNSEIDFFQFEVIPSAYELQREHKVMKHCINTYIDRIIKNSYLAVRVLDKISNEHSTLGLNIDNGNKIKFDQLKSYQNSRSSPYLINAVIKFFDENNIDYKNGSQFDLARDGDRSMRDSRKEVLPLEKCDKFRHKLLKKRLEQINNKEEIVPQEYEKLIEEFHQLFIDK